MFAAISSDNLAPYQWKKKIVKETRHYMCVFGENKWFTSNYYGNENMALCFIISTTGTGYLPTQHFGAHHVQ